MGVNYLVLRFSSQGTRFYFVVKVPFLQARSCLGIEVPVWGQSEFRARGKVPFLEGGLHVRVQDS